MSTFTHFLSPIRDIFRQRFERWLSKRLPPSLKKTLDNRSIFIFPTRFGFAYLFAMVLIFLLGTNYQNNVIILFAYLLASMFITVMMQSYFNFKGLTIEGIKEVTGYAKQYLAIAFTLSSTKPRHSLTLRFKDQKKIDVDFISGTKQIEVPYFANKRGEQTLNRLKIESEHALGLFKTWTWCDFSTSAIIYPQVKPLPAKLLNQHVQGKQLENERGTTFVEGVDDFNELNTYRDGEPLSRISWKHVARGQGKYTKNYHQALAQDTWLTLSSMPGSNIEHKLSYLCYLVGQHSGQEGNYGLDLNGIQIMPNNGQVHQAACLKALANY